MSLVVAMRVMEDMQVLLLFVKKKGILQLSSHGSPPPFVLTAGNDLWRISAHFR